MTMLENLPHVIDLGVLEGGGDEALGRTVALHAGLDFS